MPLGDLLSFGGDVLNYFGQKKGQKIAKQQFAAQMDESVQRRVADAKKAGIHPLFALGGGVGASPTITGQADHGSALGDAVANVGARMTAKKMAKAQHRLAEQETASRVAANAASATRDEAEAALLNSETKRLEGNLVSRGHDSAEGVVTYPYPHEGPQVKYGPATFFNPEIPTSKVQGVQSGTSPAEADFVFPDGRKIRTYGDNLQADEIKQIDIVYQRAIHKGTDAFVAVENWLKKRGLPFKWLRGESPKPPPDLW